MTTNSKVETDEFGTLVDHVYDAAIEPDHWPIFMQHLVEALNAKSCLLRVQHSTSHKVGAWISHKMDPCYEKSYRERYVKIDPVISMLKTYPVGTMIQTESVMPGSYKNSVYFTEYIKPQGKENLAGCLLTKDRSRMTVFGIHRPVSHGSYSEQEMLLLGRLTPHMQRAIQINSHFMELEENTYITRKILDRLPIGTVFIDEKGRAVFSNRKFEKLSASKNLLSIKENRLIAKSSRNTKALQNLIIKAVNSNSVSGRSLVLKSSDTSQSLNVLVIPFHHKSKFELVSNNSRIVAILFVSTADQQNDIPSDILVELFGFTNAEASLAVDLANGLNLEAIAEKQGVSRNTLRNHLKSCFQKTGVRRQTLLVKLILSGIPLISKDITDFTIPSDDTNAI